MTPLWISHRGLTSRYTENTKAAFMNAVENNFTALETDLRLTSDGHIVLLHDLSLIRLLKNNRLVSQLSRNELLQFRFSCDQPVFFLDEFVEEFADCLWTFDIKPENALFTIEALRQLTLVKPWLLEKFKSQTRFLMWRSGHESALKKWLPEAAFYAREIQCYRAAFANLCKCPMLGGIQKNRAYALTYQFGGLLLFKQEIVRRYQSRGAIVTAFLPDTKEEVRAAILAGVDEILTNHPIEDPTH